MRKAMNLPAASELLVSNPTANEITAIPKLLDLPDIREGTVTIDAAD
jgi:hypothetical protein